MQSRTTEFMGTPDELYHWIPGEMVVVVRLPRLPVDNTQETLVEQIRRQLNEFFRPYNITLEAYGTAGRWQITPTMPPIRRRSFLFGLHRKQPFIAIFFHTRHSNPTIQDPLPIALSYLQGHLERLAQVGLQIVSAMPNWLVTAAAPIFYGDGGPAVPPRPAPTLDIPAPANTLIGWRTKLIDQQFPLDSQGAEDVLVAVLDTAQHSDRIRSAATRPEFRRNWLLQRLANELRNDDGSLVIDYDRYVLSNETRSGRGPYHDARYYAMADHGVAVAGIIRDIAPRAHLRLVRILNDYGGGDLYGLIAALTDLEHEMVSGSIRRLVINLSLTVMPDIKRLPYIWFDHKLWPTTQINGAVRVLNHLEAGLVLLFESLYEQGALIIAAAGNDSYKARRQGRRPRLPRAPARYQSTLGVSALNSRFEPSSFTNAASIPPSTTGVATFGGDSSETLDSNALPDAVRGIYISPTFPTGEQNVSAWADWSGTSFATSIVSGLGAHLMAQGYSAGNAITRLSTRQEQRHALLFGRPPEVPSLLANVIRVQQRFGV